ncbi:carboxylesterase family protein [Glycomyces sp. A-F 0318]|uniref:carboxylesterase/lipase family protein n=1 Tax=Glycomyces amatae TaxID=2881355 RepID=UPI001E54175A|nr:carboxylesterase family protein [Glycomyces amatae]MCD0447537.1 carboxylesterase family protein [Glycomyces amatae]
MVRDEHPGGPARPPRAPVVATRAGAVRGAACDGGYRFLGVPFAAPPTGVDRYLPPRPAAPWTGVREATRNGPTPPQPPVPPPMDAFYPAVPGGEYLNIDVWTPDPGAARLPVMVWLYGGGFDGGSNTVYRGGRFARDGVVFAAPNYRLGAEGFLCLGDGVANVGLLDQVAALEWVRENIAAFGGDPGDVTVFGQSAGAMSVGALMAMPRAAGLFRRAILQSGAGNLAYTADTARGIGRRLAAKLGVAPVREAVAEAGSDRVLAAQTAVMADLAEDPDPQRWGGEPGARVNMWRPTVDGDTLPALPADAIAAGASADVDVLIGANAEEGRLSLVPFGALESITEADLAEAMRLYRLPVPRALDAYRAAYPGASPGELLAVLQGDWYYRAAATRLAEGRATAAAPTYMYEFSWRSPRFDGRLGACHALEIPFAFDLLDDPLMQWLTGPAAPQDLADLMHACWVSFARTGRADWPPYRPEGRDAFRFGTGSAHVRDPFPARALWDGVDLYEADMPRASAA